VCEGCAGGEIVSQQRLRGKEKKDNREVVYEHEKGINGQEIDGILLKNPGTPLGSKEKGERERLKPTSGGIS
jgi:hypothetical protein